MSSTLAIWIDERLPFANENSFDDTEAYERPKGRVLFTVDPLAAAQTDVVDLDKAPRGTTNWSGSKRIS